MKVKEYLVNRILKLEEELKQARNEKSGIAYALQKLQEDVIKLNEKIEQYQIEREHIREIITCNIVPDRFRRPMVCISENIDLKTLLDILDIQPGDWTMDEIHSKCDEIHSKCDDCHI